MERVTAWLDQSVMVYLTAQDVADRIFDGWNRVFLVANARLIMESDCNDLLADEWETGTCDSDDEICCDGCCSYEHVYIDGDYYTLQLDGDQLRYCYYCMYICMDARPAWYREGCVQEFIEDVCDALLDELDRAMSHYPNHYEGIRDLDEDALGYIRDIAQLHGDARVLAIMDPIRPRCTGAHA